MSPRPSHTAEETWRRELRETTDCVPIERFGEELTTQEREHVAHCARCEAEVALWEEFRDATPSPDEGAAVQWIAAEVARRRAGTPAAARQPWFNRRWFGVLRPQALAAAAAVVLVALTIGQLADREPAIVTPPSDQNEFRSARIETIAPTGDLPYAPTELSWVAVRGAERYDVEVLEVDRTVLWRASTREPRVQLAAGLTKQFVPGKTILWEVTARGRDGAALAQSGTQRFRVAIKR